MFSVVPLNKSKPPFFYTTSMHQQSEEVLFSCFMTTLNAGFENKLALEDVGYESGSENFNIPLLSDELAESTMIPVMKTPPLTLLLHTAQLPASHNASLYTTGYHSIALMMKKVLQFTFHLLTAWHNHKTPWVLHSSHHTSSPTLHMMT